MKLVILESPYSAPSPAALDRNLAYGRACLVDCLKHGESPIAAHLLLTQPGVLDDSIPAERERGIEAGHAWLTAADALVVYIDHGITPGMTRGIQLARQIGVTVVMRSLNGYETPVD